VALANLSARPTLSVLDVMVEVAIRFTHRFAPADRDYTRASDKPPRQGAAVPGRVLPLPTTARLFGEANRRPAAPAISRV
jgi:hypothetical protein